MDSDDMEEELREALDRAWAAFHSAEPERKDAAQERFRIVLEQFTAVILPRYGGPGE